MIRYDEHPSKAAAWREGRFVVLPDAEQAVADYLDSREQHGDLLFETGRSAPRSNF